MPAFGMGMGMSMRQSLRQEQRIEQRLEHILMQLQLQLGGEKGNSEQRKILEKIKKDLDNNVYSDVNEFHYRVMKRIKKEKRTKTVKHLVNSLRELISCAKEKKEISLSNVRDVVELGLASLNQMFYADTAFKRMSDLSKKINNPLDEIIGAGTAMIRANADPGSFFNDVAVIEDKTKGEFTAQESYDKAISIMSLTASSNRKILANMLSDVMMKKRSYDRFRIDTLFELINQTCELAVPNDPVYSAMPVSSLIGKQNLEEIIKKYSKIPLPILSELALQGIEEKALERMNEFAGTKHMRKSRDNKRAYLSSLIGIRIYRFSSRAIEDILLKSNGMKQAREILARFAGMCKIGMARYDFNLPDGDAILKYLNRKEFANPVLNQLSSEALKKFESIVSKNLHDKYITAYHPILHLGNLYSNTYQEGIKLLAEIMESLLFDNFTLLRYHGEVADGQLSCLGGDVMEWKKNTEKKRILGDMKGLEPQYKAVMKIVENLARKYQTIYGEGITIANIAALQERKAGLIEQLTINKLTNTDSPELVNELNMLEAKLGYAHVVYDLNKLELEKLPEIMSIIKGCLNKYSNKEFRTGIEDIVKIARSKELESVKPVTIRETDDPNHTINVGCVPVRSCQRWTEQTSYNDCLLAYVVDANKKVFHVVDDSRNVRVRSIVRLIEADELEDTPVLFVERPYADIASNDLFKALLGGVIEKAYKMSRETGEPVAVAVQDNDYCKILKKLAKGMKIDYHSDKTLHSSFPRSRCELEYSDAFGGKIGRDRIVRASDVGYVIINHEDN